MRTILSMFAKSPFKPLVSHIDQVNECVNKIKPLFDAIARKIIKKSKKLRRKYRKLNIKPTKLKLTLDSIYLKVYFYP